MKKRKAMKTTMRASLFLAAAMLAATSCKKADEQPSMAVDRFVCATESHVGDGKTSLADKEVHWSAGDKIRIWNESNEVADFDLKQGVGTPSGVFEKYGSGTLGESASYVSFYPNSGSFNKSQNKITGVSLPSGQKHAKGGFYTKTNPMAGYSSGDKRLTFQNLCGLLKVRLQGNYSVSSIKIKDNNASTSLWGTGSVVVTPPSGGNGEASFLLTVTGGSNVLYLDCGNVDVSNGEDFYFVLPKGALSSGFVIEVDCGEGGVFTRDTGNTESNTIEAGKIKEMPSLVVAPQAIPDQEGGLLPGEFSVAGNKKVQFSQGNLQYNPKQDKWRFAQRQWDYCEHANGETTHYREDYDGWIDLFGWGTSNYYCGQVRYRPWDTNNNESEYSPNSGNLTVESQSDWGSNEILGKTWRTLTSNEWVWLLGPTTNGVPNPGTNCRTSSKVGDTENARWALVKVDDIFGLLLFPDKMDEWPSNVVVPSNINTSWNDLNYTTTDFDLLEDKGCVFLPGVGYRIGTDIHSVNTECLYWSSSVSSGDAIKSDDIIYTTNYFLSLRVSTRSYGKSVRLVQEITPSVK